MEKKQSGDFADDIQQEELQALKASAKEAADLATDFIRKHPIQCVLGAVALGLLAGHLLGKRNKHD